MNAHWRYLKYVAKHKWFVFLASRRLRVPLHQAIVHDWHKFLPSEWFPYVQHFYGKDAPQSREAYYHRPDMAKAKFNTAWLTHLQRGKHHWQHWLLINDTKGDGEREWYVGSMDDLDDCFIAIRGSDPPEGRLWVHQSGMGQPNAFLRWKIMQELIANANRAQPIALQMPDRFVREMVADWSGAGRAQGHGDDVIPWYTKNRDRMILHLQTRARVESLIGYHRTEADGG